MPICRTRWAANSLILPWWGEKELECCPHTRSHEEAGARAPSRWSGRDTTSSEGEEGE